MRISVIVCTYRRVDDVRRLLECLRGQTFGDFEVLVGEGIEPGTSVPRASADFGLSGDGHFNLKVLAAPLGLPHQRNVGMREACGELLCFLDDDVTVERTFLEQISDLFAQPAMRDVG